MSARATRTHSESPHALRNRDSPSDNQSRKERAQSVKARRSTVSNTHAAPLQPRFQSCLTSIQVPAKMLVGINVIKVNGNGKRKFAFLTLSQDQFTVYITTTQIRNNNGKHGILHLFLHRVASIGRHNDDEYEYERAIDIGSITRIQKGQSTLKFELAHKHIKNKFHLLRKGMVS